MKNKPFAFLAVCPSAHSTLVPSAPKGEQARTTRDMHLASPFNSYSAAGLRVLGTHVAPGVIDAAVGSCAEGRMMRAAVGSASHTYIIRSLHNFTPRVHPFFIGRCACLPAYTAGGATCVTTGALFLLAQQVLPTWRMRPHLCGRRVNGPPIHTPHTAPAQCMNTR